MFLFFLPVCLNAFFNITFLFLLFIFVHKTNVGTFCFAFVKSCFVVVGVFQCGFFFLIFILQWKHFLLINTSNNETLHCVFFFSVSKLSSGHGNVTAAKLSSLAAVHFTRISCEPNKPTAT